MPDQTRKLAAIVFTDIVGFTKLSAENEPAALSLLEKQRELLKPIVDNHSGSWLKEVTRRQSLLARNRYDCQQ
jgi:class 3 adenylate cyclase